MRHHPLLPTALLFAACAAPAPVAPPIPAPTPPPRASPTANTGPSPEPLTAQSLPPEPPARAPVAVYQAALRWTPSHLLKVRSRPDGAAFAVSDIAVVQVRDGATGQLRAQRRFDAVETLEWSATGDVLAVLTGDAHAHLWSMRDGSVAEFALPDTKTAGRTGAQRLGRLFDLSWSPDGRYLAVLGEGGFAVWDLSARVARLVTEAWDDGNPWTRAFAWAPDGRTFAAADRDGHASVRDAATSAVVRAVPANEGDHLVAALAVSPDGRRLAFGQEDGPPRVVDLQSGQVSEGPTSAGAGVSALAWDPAGLRIAVGSKKPQGVWRWDLGTGDARALAPAMFVGALRWTPTGDRIVSMEGSMGVRFVDATHPTPAVILGDYATPDPAFARALRLNQDGPAQIVDLATKAELATIRKDSQSTWASALVSGNHVLWRRPSHVISLDLSGAKVAAVLDHPREERVLSPDGRRVAHLHDARKTTVTIEDATTGAAAGPTIAVEDYEAPSYPLWSPGGRYLSLRIAKGRVHRQRVWDARTGAVVATVPLTDSIDHVAFAGNDSAIVTSSRDTAKIVNLPAGTVRFTRHVDSWQTGAWSPDGARVAIGPPLALLDGHTGAEIVPLPGSVRSPWSPDGRTIVLGSTRTNTCIWDANARACAVALALSNADTVIDNDTWLTWSPSGRALARRPARPALVEIYDAASGALRTTVPDPDRALVRTWVDDDHLLIADNELVVTRLSDGASVTIAAADDDASVLVTAPDGSFEGGPSALGRLLVRDADVVKSTLRPVHAGDPGWSAGLLRRLLGPKATSTGPSAARKGRRRR